MKALVLHELKTPLRLENVPEPEPPPGHVVVRLHAAALNRRDFWITQGLYPGVRLPVVPGSDGAGVVSSIGEGVASDWVDSPVVINPGIGWGESESFQDGRFEILGMPADGTFAESVAVPVSNVAAKPEHLSWPQAAAVPLAGVTAFRAVMTQGQVTSGEKVLVTGAGGGVATFAIQFAVLAGATVFCTSSSDEKRSLAIDLGARAAFDYSDEDWAKHLQADHGPVNLIIDGAGGDGYSKLLDLAAFGGRIVSYGATAGPSRKLELTRVFWKQLRLIGSTMGSPADFAAMLQAVGESRLQPVIDNIYPLSEGNTSLKRMQRSEQCGKIVLDTSARAAG